MIFTREMLEENERRCLATYAMKSSESMGRKFNETIEDDRLCFQRDKDRIIHCKAFRRMDEKTQVFMAGTGDHYRTRLTHSLEVAQISRDIARRLGLNEDLCEAIALAHDIGHPPFGHGGEDALDEIMREYGFEFEHNKQSRRIVENLEKLYPNFDGLNLTLETLDGLIKHQSAWDQAEMDFETSAHLEAQVVNCADEIAYTNHDMDDGIRSGLITVNGLSKFELWNNALKEVHEKYGKQMPDGVLVSRIISTIISFMIENLCKTTSSNIEKFGIKTVNDVRRHKGQIVCFSNEMVLKIAALRKFLYDNFYVNPKIVMFVDLGKEKIKKLFNFYMNNPTKLSRKEFLRGDDDLPTAVKDYIAGMTDGFLIAEFEKHL